MYIYLLTNCELKLLHDHSNILHNAHYACFTSTTSLAVCSTPCGFQAGHSRVQVSTRSRAALYLSNDCLLAAEVGRLLRSADARTCVVPRTRTKFGDRSFAVAGPRVWTRTLATPLHDTNSIYSFKKQLKTYLV